MAATKPVTEADYLARKGVLQAHRVAAEQEYNRQAYAAHVEDEGADPAKAKQNVDLIDGQLGGLEAAWTEACQLAKKQAKRVEAQARRVRLKRISTHLASRTKAVAELNSVLKLLADPLSSFREASTAIVHELKEHSREFSHFPTQVFFTVWPAPDPLERLMAGMLFKAGVDLHKVDFTTGGYFVHERGGLSAWVKYQNIRIEEVAETIAPADEKGER